MTEKRQCSKVILTDSVWNPSRPCHKPATVERDRVWYCKTHDPEYIKEKEAKQRDVWDKEFKLRRAEIKAGEQCLFINPDNPVAVAEAIGDMYEALKALVNALGNPMGVPPFELVEKASNALNKAGGKE